MKSQKYIKDKQHILNTILVYNKNNHKSNYNSKGHKKNGIKKIQQLTKEYKIIVEFFAYLSLLFIILFSLLVFIASTSLLIITNNIIFLNGYLITVSCLIFIIKNK